MHDEPCCQLTAKDISVLEGMLEMLEGQGRGNTPTARLLRRKLAAARIRFRDDIDPRVATINSRIQFRIDSGNMQTRVLTHGGENALPGLALPISSLHGLALLGLAENDAIVVDTADGGTETLRVVRVVHQPEAARLRSLRANFAVIANPRPAATHSADGLRRAETTEGPDDDDPGPRAA